VELAKVALILVVEPCLLLARLGLESCEGDHVVTDGEADVLLRHAG
jgi:hypothetical protein